eukprot:TRINITY_DN2490_c0_g2_i1.p1 TRINITY_DN2490_c0_g2~~TRINITY_DN2490_c0_g2_i1.p1  ORF type:complete len:221 (-),score=35.58 TRINITY_DN2490_c0_g2_i1:954-1616(-)
MAVSGFSLGLCLVLLAALLAPSLSSADESQPEIRKLTDQNFEHDTQAGTGQTTGHWLVLFTKDSPASKEAREVFIKTAAQLEGQPILAEVDIETSPNTAKRFAVEIVPELRLFRDRSMVKYAGDWDAEDILLFIQEGWKALPKDAVPKEPAFADGALLFLFELRAAFFQFFNQFPMALALIGGIVALGTYVLTKRYMKGRRSAHRRRRPPIHLQKRAKIQ